MKEHNKRKEEHELLLRQEAPFELKKKQDSEGLFLFTKRTIPLPNCRHFL